MITHAWYVATLSRQKKIGTLKEVLDGKKSQVLEGEDLKKRRQEFKEMSEAWHKRPH